MRSILFLYVGKTAIFTKKWNNRDQERQSRHPCHRDPAQISKDGRATNNQTSQMVADGTATGRFPGPYVKGELTFQQNPDHAFGAVGGFHAPGADGP